MRRVVDVREMTLRHPLDVNARWTRREVIVSYSDGGDSVHHIHVKSFKQWSKGSTLHKTIRT